MPRKNQKPKPAWDESSHIASSYRAMIHSLIVRMRYNLQHELRDALRRIGALPKSKGKGQAKTVEQLANELLDYAQEKAFRKIFDGYTLALSEGLFLARYSASEIYERILDELRAAEVRFLSKYQRFIIYTREVKVKGDDIGRSLSNLERNYWQYVFNRQPAPAAAILAKLNELRERTDLSDDIQEWLRVMCERMQQSDTMTIDGIVQALKSNKRAFSCIPKAEKVTALEEKLVGQLNAMPGRPGDYAALQMSYAQDVAEFQSCYVVPEAHADRRLQRRIYPHDEKLARMDGLARILSLEEQFSACSAVAIHKGELIVSTNELKPRRGLDRIAVEDMHVTKMGAIRGYLRHLAEQFAVGGDIDETKEESLVLQLAALLTDSDRTGGVGPIVPESQWGDMACVDANHDATKLSETVAHELKKLKGYFLRSLRSEGCKGFTEDEMRALLTGEMTFLSSTPQQVKANSGLSMHCEQAIVQYLNVQDPAWKQGRSGLLRLGVSRMCCQGCRVVLKEYIKLGVLMVRGSHDLPFNAMDVANRELYAVEYHDFSERDMRLQVSQVPDLSPQVPTEVRTIDYVVEEIEAVEKERTRVLVKRGFVAHRLGRLRKQSVADVDGRNELRKQLDFLDVCQKGLAADLSALKHELNDLRLAGSRTDAASVVLECTLRPQVDSLVADCSRFSGVLGRRLAMRLAAEPAVLAHQQAIAEVSCSGPEVCQVDQRGIPVAVLGFGGERSEDDERLRRARIDRDRANLQVMQLHHEAHQLQEMLAVNADDIAKANKALAGDMADSKRQYWTENLSKLQARRAELQANHAERQTEINLLGSQIAGRPDQSWLHGDAEMVSLAQRLFCLSSQGVDDFKESCALAREVKQAKVNVLVRALSMQAFKDAKEKVYPPAIGCVVSVASAAGSRVAAPVSEGLRPRGISFGAFLVANPRGSVISECRAHRRLFVQRLLAPVAPVVVDMKPR